MNNFAAAASSSEDRDHHEPARLNRMSMKPLLILLAGIVGFGISSFAQAAGYGETIDAFKKAGVSAGFFRHAYGYAVFPTVGEGGFIVGAAVGKGRVYVHRRLVGDTTMTQLSAGFQAGGKAYSQIIFFENKRALDQFESGSFEFAAGASATAITASAGGSAGTLGASASASGTVNNATTAGAGYTNGTAVFTIAKGGLMYAATLAGQKYSYTPRGAPQ
jgi:lipid-binding SYLF domain-containing protein